MLSLANKTIWLTGASQGIGAALAAELIARGARVAMTARSESTLLELERSLGLNAHCFPGDVTQLSEMQAIASKIEQKLGEIDFVIANAGSCIYINPENFKSEDCLALMNLNYGGVLRCIEAVLPAMLKRGRGGIVGIASLAGYRGLPRAAAYGATKAGLIHFLESFRFHCERRGISVTVVNPGFVKTPLTDKNDFPMPSLVSSETAARYICDGLEKQKKEITFPPVFSIFMKFLRILPSPIYLWCVNQYWKRLGYV